MQNTGPVGSGKDVTSPIGFDASHNIKMQPVPFIPVDKDSRDTILNYLLRSLEEKDNRIKELTNLLLSQAGISDTKVIVPQAEEKQEIAPAKQRWDKVKAQLEKRYAVTKEELEKASSHVNSISDDKVLEERVFEDEVAPIGDRI